MDIQDEVRAFLTEKLATVKRLEAEIQVKMMEIGMATYDLMRFASGASVLGPPLTSPGVGDELPGGGVGERIYEQERGLRPIPVRFESVAPRQPRNMRDRHDPPPAITPTVVSVDLPPTGENPVVGQWWPVPLHSIWFSEINRSKPIPYNSKTIDGWGVVWKGEEGALFQSWAARYWANLIPGEADQFPSLDYCRSAAHEEADWLNAHNASPHDFPTVPNQQPAPPPSTDG